MKVYVLVVDGLVWSVHRTLAGARRDTEPEDWTEKMVGFKQWKRKGSGLNIVIYEEELEA